MTSKSYFGNSCHINPVMLQVPLDRTWALTDWKEEPKENGCHRQDVLGRTARQGPGGTSVGTLVTRGSRADMR